MRKLLFAASVFFIFAAALQNAAQTEKKINK